MKTPTPNLQRAIDAVPRIIERLTTEPGATLCSVCEEYGVSRNIFSPRLWAAMTPEQRKAWKSSSARGPRSAARLAAEISRVVQRLTSERGLTLARLAEEYDVDPTSVANYVRRAMTREQYVAWRLRQAVGDRLQTEARA